MPVLAGPRGGGILGFTTAMGCKKGSYKKKKRAENACKIQRQNVDF